MKNRGWKIFGVVVILVAAVVLVATLTIDGIVKSSIQEKGSELLQTTVAVDNVDISIFGGTGSISGLTVENPEGFSEEHAIRIQQADIELQLLSLFTDVVVIEDLRIQSPEVFFEQQETQANLKILNDNIDVTSDEPQKSLIVDHLLIEDIFIRVSTSVDRERTGEARLERFELEDIGRDGNNTIKESLREIINPLLEQAMAKAIQEGLFDQLENRVQDLFNGN